MGYIIVDFDGTVVTHEYPRMGKDIGAIPVLKELVANGHQLILFTMRSDMGVKSGKFESGLIYHESGVVYDPNTFSPVNTYILRYCLTDLIDTEDNQKEEIKERKINFKYLLIKT